MEAEAVDWAPPIPEDRIAQRRWWNQICINALSWDIPSGCIFIGVVNCVDTHGIKENTIPCTRCEGHLVPMCTNPKETFIGFETTDMPRRVVR